MAYRPRSMRDRPGDPIEDVLGLLHVQTAVSSGLRAGGAWCIRFGPYAHVKFTTVLRGACWLAPEGGEAVRLEEGDCYLASTGHAYRLGSDLSLPAAEAAAVFSRVGADRIARHGVGEPVVELLGGSFTFAARNAALLLDTLPPVVVIRRDDAAAPRAAEAVRWAMAQLAAEGAGGTAEPGASVIVERLADILLVQALRVVSAAGAGAGLPGWLPALAHPQIGEALRLMHAEPGRRWTVAALAHAVGLSRSSFAERFRALVGVPPLEYLQRWRMHAAAEALQERGRTVASVAFDAGYASESAFSAAFKRTMGQAPTHHRDARA